MQTRYQYIAEKMMNQLEEAYNKDNNANTDDFKSVSDIFFEKYLMDDFCNCFIRLMLIEQCNNSTMQQLYTNWMVDMPLQFQQKIFDKINLLYSVKDSNSEYLSLKYYAPIFLYAHKYLFVGELTEVQKSLFSTAVAKHIQLFMNEIGVK